MNSPEIAVATSGAELRYGATQILRGIDLSLHKGKTLALLGPSGCGKTTLLRLVAGLLQPTGGRITIDGKIAADAATGLFVPPEKRNLGMVFQDYALWPHMTVAGNVSFPLEMRGVSRSERERRIAAALQRVGLGGFGERRTSDMSGGQQQRVAIARAIVAEPGIVLFDEPLSNLDRELRETMVAEIGELVSTLGLTAIYVTHDHSEAFSLADEVAIMHAGTIEQLAVPEDLVDRPASPWVAEFLRLGCVAPVERRKDLYVIAGTGIALGAGPAADGDSASHVLLPSGSVRLGAAGAVVIPARVTRTMFRGDGHQVSVEIGTPAAALEMQFPSRVKFQPGDPIDLSFAPDDLRWFSNNPIQF